MKTTQNCKQDLNLKKWFRLLTTTLSDAVAVLLGAKDLGTSTSTAVNNLLTDLEKAINKDDKVSHIKKEALVNVEPGSAGYIHNKVIINLYEKYGTSIDTLTTEQLVDLSSKEVCTLTDENNLPISKSDAVLLVNNIAGKMDLTKSISENIENLKTLTIDPELQNKLEICGTFIEGLQMVDDNDTTYVKSAHDLIINSNLPTNDKIELQNALSVGYASAKLWNTEALEDCAE